MVFRFSCSRFLAHFSLVGFLGGSPPKNSSNFWNSEGVARKHGKTRTVFGCLVAGFFLVVLFFHVVSLCSCFSSCAFFVANVWFVLAVLLVPFVFFLFPAMVFFFGGGGAGGFSSLTSINSMVLYQWSKKQDQNTEKPNIWNSSFWCSALEPASSHFQLAQMITVTLNPPPLKIVFVYFVLFLTMCWNTYFYSAFWTSTKFAPTICALINDNFAQCAKQNLVF